MGRAERTENDPQFGILSDKTDKTKNYTEKIVKVCEAKTEGMELKRRLRRHLGGLLGPLVSPQELLETRWGSFAAAFGAQEGPKEEARDATAVLEQFRAPEKKP